MKSSLFIWLAYQKTSIFFSSKIGYYADSDLDEDDFDVDQDAPRHQQRQQERYRPRQRANALKKVIFFIIYYLSRGRNDRVIRKLFNI